MSNGATHIHPQQRRPFLTLVAICCAAAAALLVSSGFVIWTTRSTALQEQERELGRLSIAVADHAQRAMFDLDLILSDLEDLIARNGKGHAAAFESFVTPPDMHALLRDKIRVMPHIDGVFFVSRDGRALNAARSWPPPSFDVTDRDYFRALREDSARTTFISEPLVNLATGQVTIFLARRINAVDGSLVGLIVGVIATSHFERFYEKISPGRGGAIDLYRRDGALLVRYPESGRPGPRTQDRAAEFDETIAISDRAVTHTPHRGADDPSRILALHVVRGYPLVAGVSIQRQEVLAGWWRLTGVVCAAGGTALLLIAVIALAFRRHLSLEARVAESTAAREAAEQARTVAEASNKAKSDFLANMSHELRTPLNAILGFADLLDSKAFGPLNDRQGQYLGDIAKSGKYLLEFIDTVLDMATIESGRFDLKESQFPLAPLLGEAVAAIEARARDGGLVLRRPHGDDLPALRADRRALLRVLTSLLTNAVDFTAPGGTVSLTVEQEDGGTLNIAVADTGCGIAPERLDRLFEPFQRDDAHRSRSGRGLGLPLSKMLVERHGGRLVVDSTVGAGTTVGLRLPAHRVVQARDGRSPRPEPQDVRSVAAGSTSAA